MNPDVLAGVCFYATDIHKGSLGKGGDDTLERMGELKSEMLMIWGRQDPHVPTEGRALNKAERMGIYRPRIASEGQRTIEVRGRTPDGDRAYITFSRQPGCPVLDY
jgi:hypothetical protein